MSDFQEAMRPLNRWYESEIRSLVEDFEKQIKSGEIEDADDLEMTISETLDNHEFVIYTGQSWAVCLCSSHENAYEEEMGTKPPTIEAQALWAMRTDVYDRLDVVALFREREEKAE